MNEALSLPDRFEGLERKAPNDLKTIVVAVDESLAIVDQVYGEMKAAGRGGFLVLRGDSGFGKSTFLHTIGLFRQGVSTHSIPGGVDIRAFLSNLPKPTHQLEVFVLEEREAVVEFTDQELETILHAVNGFIRSSRGESALVVWPCNTDSLRDRVVSLAAKVGGESLLGVGSSSYKFVGPVKDAYRGIAERTLSVLNQSASFSDLGLDSDTVDLHIAESTSIGSFLARLRNTILANEQRIQKLIKAEQCRLWVVVIAGNDPGSDVDALTRGSHASIDIDRLLSSTGANVVSDLKEHPEQLGILGTALDAKILHLPVLTAQAIMRAFADPLLRIKMRGEGLQVGGVTKLKAIERLATTEVAQVFSGKAQGTLSRGPKIGSNTVESFKKLSNIASNNDTILNKALGAALLEAKLIKGFKTEQDFGSGLKRRTDLLCDTQSSPVRIEVMWRAKTGRAEIANYTLLKLLNYGKAIGFLK